MCEEELKKLLKERLSEKRYIHTIAVADTAEKLAGRLFESPSFAAGREQDSFMEKVRLAALLHDYAKELSYDKLMEYVSLAQTEWEIDADELQIAEILHAPVSVYLARTELGIEDQEILEAVRFHAIGKIGMGIVAELIFAADFIEPNRNFSAARKVREEISKNGLESGIIMICDLTIKYHVDNRRLLHPNAVLLRNAYLRRQA